MYDVKLVNGTIVDGSGSPRFVGDVGIRAGRLAAVGDAPEPAAREIDVSGLIVCPGFVDTHTHYDAQFFWDRMMSPSPWYGVTTVVMGNCGFGLAPAKPADRQFLLETLQHVEGIPFSCSWPAMGSGDWGFETFPEFLDLIDRRGSALNIVTQIGHTALRTWVMGPDSARSRVATDEEIEQMRQIVIEALNAGAAALSMTTSGAHVGAGGIPVPSRWADHREHLELARAVTEARQGLWQGTFGSIIIPEFVLEVMEKTGVRTIEITPAPRPVGGPGGEHDPEILAELADLGYVSYGEMGIVPNILYTGLHEPFMFAFDQPGGVFMISTLHDLFADIMDLHTVEERLAAYKEATFLARFVEATDNDGWNSSYWPVITIAVAPTRPEWEGRRIVDVAEETGRKPAEILYEISVDSDLAARINIISEVRDRAHLMKQDFVRLGLHDAGAHLAQIGEHRWPLNLMGSYVREREIVSLERAVHMATFQSADSYGIMNRGLLIAGWPADVVVFDPDTIIDGPIREYHDLPGGAARLMAEPIGIEYVMVNGVMIREHNKDVVGPDDELPGRLLRDFSSRKAQSPKPIPKDLRDRIHALTVERLRLNAERRNDNPPAMDPAQPGKMLIW
jgi:N-acyl-D-aspartate/D-glutamate deacylase